MILIIDGNNMAYRARYTHSLSFRGVDTSVTFGMLHMLYALLKQHRPRSIIVCFDGGTPEFRKRLWPSYKEHRSKDEDTDWDDVYRQINELAYLALPIHGVMSIRSKNIEADDLMAQAAQIVTDRPYIVTGDDDLLQCIDKSTSIINPTKGIIYDLEEFRKEYGFPVDYFLLYKMLCGDSSDNISGVPGIGDKTARAMIRMIINLELDEIYNHSKLVEVIDYLHVNKRQKANFLAMGEATWEAMYEVMDLWEDRAGARAAISRAHWTKADVGAMQRYYMNNGFMSLMEDAAHIKFSKLERPPFKAKWRTPITIRRGWK